MSVNPRLWAATVVVEDDNVASQADVASTLPEAIRALLTGQRMVIEGRPAETPPFYPDEVKSVAVLPLPMTGGKPEFPPYHPAPDGEPAMWDAPLSAQELAMAVELFRTVRYLASSIHRGELAPDDHTKSRYVLRIDFDETQPPDARVHIIYDCHEWSSGYREDGVGPDFGTALSRLSEDDKTNGTSALVFDK